MTHSGRGASGGVVITGASSGIGEACALHLAEVGFHVFAGVRKAADGEALQGKAAGRLTPVLIDVTDADSIAAAVETVTAAVGSAGLAGLVNNAGISIASPLEFVPLAELRAQFEVNVVGQVAVTQAFLPLIRQAKGRVVNIGSIGGRMAVPFLGPYAASKFALEALTDCLRVELRPWGIHVSIVEPGNITTPIWEKSRSSAKAMLEHLPQRAHELYGPAIARMWKITDRMSRSGLPAEIVGATVGHALTTQHPKTRYVIGREAKLQALMAIFMPDRMRDNLIVRSLRLPE